MIFDPISRLPINSGHVTQSEFPVRVIRSRRKTMSATISGPYVVVKAPLSATDTQIRRFLSEHDRWIRTHLEKEAANDAKARQEGYLTEAEIRSLADQALKTIPERVRHYAALMGITYGRITIRNQKTRWGSCSSKGNLNFNCLLMLCPPEVIDAVVVHELAHRKQMNHSEAFYRIVLQAYPEYRKWDRWLKQNGPAILKRMTA